MANIAYQGVNIDLDKLLGGLSAAQLKAMKQVTAKQQKVKEEAEKAAAPTTPRGRGVWQATYKVVLQNPALKDDALFVAVCKEITVANKDGKKTSKDLVNAERKYFLRIVKYLQDSKVDLTKIVVPN